MFLMQGIGLNGNNILKQSHKWFQVHYSIKLFFNLDFTYIQCWFYFDQKTNLLNIYQCCIVYTLINNS